MVALGNDHASKVLAQLDDGDVTRLAWLVAHTDRLEADRRDDVLRDFYASLTSHETVSVGGPETVQRLLESAFGAERAAEMQTNLGTLGQTKPFKFLERVPLTLLVEFLGAEHPQIVALVLAHLEPDHAVSVLTQLPVELQVNTLSRIVGLEDPSPEAVKLTETIIEKRLSGALFSVQDGDALQGAEQLIELLRNVDIATQTALIDGIADIDPELAARVRQQLFVFDDLLLLDDRSLQRVLRDVDKADLTLAMRAAAPEVQEAIFQNMSTRAAAMAREDVAALAPVRLSVVHEAQNRIVSIVRQLQASDEIVINRGGADELVA